MFKYRPNNKNVPIGTVAPIVKKAGAGLTGKSGAGFVPKTGKSGGSFGSSAKSKTGGSFGSSAKSKSGGSFGAGGKSSSAFSPSGKASLSPRAPSFIPLGSSGKSTSSKPAVPLLGGATSASAFASSTSKNYTPTSYSNPKKSSTFGIIWIPGRKRNKKKEYVHVSHRDDGYRSPSMYPYEFNYNNMSGDSQSHPTLKKKDEDSNLLSLERPKGPIATAASAGTAIIALDEKPPQTQESSEPSNPEEKEEKAEFIKYDREDSKEAAGDANYDDRDSKSFLDNDTDSSKPPESKGGKEKGDKVDSVYLRPPPSNKVRSNTSTNEDEDCGIKCLYYTLQCCDCVLM